VPNELAQSMEPISPELVLVDPELARRARARLPDAGHSNGGTGRLLADAMPSLEAVPPIRAGPQPAVRLRFLVVAVGLLVVALGVLIWPLISEDDPVPPNLSSVGAEKPRQGQTLCQGRYRDCPSSAPEPRRPAPSDRSTSRPARPARQIKRKAERSERVRRRPVAKPKARPRPSKAPAASKEPTARLKTGPPARRTVAPVPTRLFVWLPSRGAGYYNVRFFKGSRTIYEAWPTDPSVTVPMRGTFRGKRFEFAKGRYRWIVRPAFGPRSHPRYGEPIVRSIWVAP
jgi:hypothetical protein